MRRPSQEELGLATALTDLAGALQARRDVSAVCEEVVLAGARFVPDAEDAVLSLAERKGMRTAAATGESAQRMGALQYWCRQGPSIQAIDDGTPVRVDSLRHESRWPEFTRRVIQREGGSVLTLPLTVEGRAVGALMLWARKDEAFDAVDERIGTLMAAHAAVAVAGARERGHLRAALDSRDVIGQATGILMERRRISAHEAFGLLSGASQHMNRKLREVAERLVWSGDFTEPHKRRGQRPAGGAAAGPH
ncbi:GAF and ANTAR domain-containing protein [Streptomonospora alba]|uniref:GAF and ANTAR domain-containing protein n=1 Tax=Streptomonospora alba TaxID=183763 RepID=UPI00069B3830|nr:GAF and ANTAR domain-containing protein [Streptomonospora alba]